jgi:hypothetical protein
MVEVVSTALAPDSPPRLSAVPQRAQNRLPSAF